MVETYDKCPNCNSTNYEQEPDGGAVFCNGCGKSVEKEKFPCDFCGKEHTITHGGSVQVITAHGDHLYILGKNIACDDCSEEIINIMKTNPKTLVHIVSTKRPDNLLVHCFKLNKMEND